MTDKQKTDKPKKVRRVTPEETKVKAILEKIKNPPRGMNDLSAKETLENAFAEYLSSIICDEKALIDFFVSMVDKGNYGVDPETGIDDTVKGVRAHPVIGDLFQESLSSRS